MSEADGHFPTGLTPKGPASVSSANTCRSDLSLFRGLRSASIPLIKPIHTAGRIDKLLFAREERVAGRAYFYMQLLSHRRTGLE